MLILDVDDHLAVHLVEAIRVHRRYLRECGRTSPPEYADLELTLAAQGMRSSSPKVMEGHGGSILGDLNGTVDSEAVTTTDLLDYVQSARRLRCSVSTVKRRIAAGDLIPVRHGRISRLRAADIDAYLTSHEGR